ncbi:MAG: ABC transporter ATP-binding protein [Phycisphaerales bacterium]|nr:MAG: ABC transporter ATP-binding protein [Phycisphaerales bacterium]
MLNVRDIRHSFGPVHALRGVTFAQTRGEVVALLGPNGAGKTTTIRCVTGYLTPHHGSVTLAGHDLRKDPIAARQHLGYLPESAPLYPELTPTQYLDFRARLYRIPRRQRRLAIQKALDRCRVADVATRRIGHLSKGYRQRVGLAAALVHEPAVLVLDEPSNGLDPGQIREMRSLVRELAADRTMLVSSHILPEIEQLADRMVVIAGGRVLAVGSGEELRRAHAGGTRLVAEAAPSSGALDAPTIAGARLIENAPLEGNWRRLVFEPVSSLEETDILSALAAVFLLSGWRLRELRRDKPSLEAVFMRLTESAAEPSPKTKEAAA